MFAAVMVQGPPSRAPASAPASALPLGPKGAGLADESRPSPSGQPEDFAPLIRAVAAAVLRERPTHADVDDAVSETMRRAIEGRLRLREGEPLRPWLLGIARHVALDVLRRRGRERPLAVPTASDSSGDVSVLDTVPDSAPSPHERVEEADRVHKVRLAMRDLPEGMKEALTLFYVEGLAYQAIAAKMGVPLGTVATWIARGRKTLSERLDEAKPKRGGS